MGVWGSDEVKKWRKKVKNKENTCMCWCGSSEVNGILTQLLENKPVKTLSQITNKIMTTERVN